MTMTPKAVLVLSVVVVLAAGGVVAVRMRHGGGMSLVSSLKRLFGIGSSSSAPHTSEKPKDELFVYVKIPAPIEPLERASRFEDPLQEALERARLGEVSGGGSMLSAPDAGGRKHIVYCGIDVDLDDAEPGLALLHRELVRLQVPDGTVLEYERNGQRFEVPITRP